MLFIALADLVPVTLTLILCIMFDRLRHILTCTGTASIVLFLVVIPVIPYVIKSSLIVLHKQISDATLISQWILVIV